MINKGLFTSNKQDYETPLDIFGYLNNIYKFDCDLFASKENALCDKYFTEKIAHLLIFGVNLISVILLIIQKFKIKHLKEHFNILY